MGAFMSDETVSHSLLRHVNYNEKTSAELRPQLQLKSTELQSSIKVREGRIVRLRDEHKISAEEMAHLLVMHHNAQKNRQQVQTMSMALGGGDENGASSMGHSERHVPAGAVANIAQEHQMIASERAQLRKINLILRNLQDEVFFYHPESGVTLKRTAVHKLDDSDLEYLGF